VRGFGELEAAIMDRLWSRVEPATVREVHTDLVAERELAYTTVLTVMDNLWKKGWLVRERAGRAHRYAPTATRGEYGAGLMREALAASGDAVGALVTFVGDLSAAESAALRGALAGHGEDEAT
jgi:predicted transcriptional regulator